MVTTVISGRPPSVNDDPRHLISATARIAEYFARWDGRAGVRCRMFCAVSQLPGTSARDGGVTGRLIVALFAVCARVAWVSEVDREHDSFVASRIDAVMCIGGAVQREWWRYGEGERSGTGHFGEVRRGLPLGWVWEIVAAE